MFHPPTEHVVYSFVHGWSLGDVIQCTGYQPAAAVGQQPQYSIPAPQGMIGAGPGGVYQPHTVVPGGPTGYQQPPPPQAQMYMPSSTTSAPQQPPQPGTAAEYQPYNVQG